MNAIGLPAYVIVSAAAYVIYRTMSTRNGK